MKVLQHPTLGLLADMAEEASLNPLARRCCVSDAGWPRPCCFGSCVGEDALSLAVSRGMSFLLPVEVRYVHHTPAIRLLVPTCPPACLSVWSGSVGLSLCCLSILSLVCLSQVGVDLRVAVLLRNPLAILASTVLKRKFVESVNIGMEVLVRNYEVGGGYVCPSAASKQHRAMLCSAQLSPSLTAALAQSITHSASSAMPHFAV
jgi:hypothetical protein